LLIKIVEVEVMLLVTRANVKAEKVLERKVILQEQVDKKANNY
jgi:hypothetical protein